MEASHQLVLPGGGGKKYLLRWWGQATEEIKRGWVLGEWQTLFISKLMIFMQDCLN